MKFINVLLYSLLIILLVHCNPAENTDFKPIITKGKQEHVILRGDKWKDGPGYVYCSGKGDNFNNMIYSAFYVKNEDFHIKMKISFDTIGQTTSIFWFFNNHFGFDSDDKGSNSKERLFMYTPKYDSLLYFQPSIDAFKPGVPFEFEIERQGTQISFFIDRQLITKQPVSLFSEPLQGTIGIRPWRNRIRIYDWSISGNVQQLPELDFVFKNGESGYACFRIPSVVQAKDGSILAFAEGRENSCRDNGDVNIVMKKSIDNGKTWGPLQLIWEDSTNTCAYPVPVVNQESGRIILLAAWNLGEDHWSQIFQRKGKDTRRIFQFFSEDHGNSWSTKREITQQVKLDNWDYYGMGAGSALQMKADKYKGRLVIPSFFSTFDGVKTHFRSHLIYSDDQGESWAIGGISPETGTSECEVAEISQNGLLLNMVKRSKRIHARSVAYSYDGGLSLQDQVLDDELYGPTCQGSLDSFHDGEGHVILFLNPNHKHARENLTLQISRDDGKNWKKVHLVHEGYAGYSDILVMQDGQIGALYECGKIWSRDGIAFKSFVLDY